MRIRSRRLNKLDAWLMAFLLPIWLLGLVLQVDRLTSDRPLAWFPAYVEPAPPGGHPTLWALWPDTPEITDALQPGDRLLEVGAGRSLRGASGLQVIQAAFLAAIEHDGRRMVPFLVDRDGTSVRVQLPLQVVPYPWNHLVLSFGIGLSAILVLWRGQGRRAPRAYAMAAVAYALHFCSLYGGQPWQTSLGFGLLIATAGLYPPLLLRALMLFPPSAAPRHRLGLLWPWLFLAGAPAAYLWLLGSPALGYGGFAPLSAVFAATTTCMLVIIVRNYRRADARGRRQMRWGFYGLIVATATPLFFSIVAAADPSLRPLYELSLATHLLIPFCFFIALVHDRLFDIDRLISTTATLTLLGIVPVALLLTIGVTFSRWLNVVTGIQESTVLGASIVLLLGPLPFVNRRLSPWVHDRLFPGRKRFENDMRALRRELADCQGSEDLFGTLVKRLCESVPLESVAIYVPIQDVFASGYAHGPLVPPGFARDGRMLTLIAATEGPISKRDWRRWARRNQLDDAERAGLEGLSAEWVIPVRRGDSIEALMCVGPKSSGDIFTTWESVLLEGVAERAAYQLDRFDEADRAQRERRLIDELSRYVPANVEQALSRGTRPAAGEYEVTVFFVDIRGSTAWSEARADSEVFVVTDRFTRGASELIEQNGGAVVEFAGDGFMAIFGAEGSSEAKEGAAIEAGRSILRSVHAGLLPGELRPRRPIGVGIATGSVYLGDIHIGSHAIWTALGDTANLAARLESLTKDYEASIVIDARTKQGAHDTTTDFAALGWVEIRGRGEPEQLYALDAPGALVA